MDIKQIECFIAVAEDLNFTTAAEKMYLSQPSLS
ncbi:MAG: LysR family transcriptional regulator, partial [Firmicutes bacterium]|nr:LysR family transcriptional regulator [Bacillota bacterium]